MYIQINIYVYIYIGSTQLACVAEARGENIPALNVAGPSSSSKSFLSRFN